VSYAEDYGYDSYDPGDQINEQTARDIASLLWEFFSDNKGVSWDTLSMFDFYKWLRNR